MAKPGLNFIHYFAVLALFSLSIMLLVFFNGFFAALMIAGLFFSGRWLIRHFTGHPTSGMALLKNGFLLVFLFVTGFFFTAFRTETNYYFFLDRHATLKVKQEGEWVFIPNARQLDRNELYSNAQVTIESIDIKRNQGGLFGRALNLFVSQKVHVFTFQPNNDFYLVGDPNHSFSPLTVHEAMERKNSHFLINSSFYDPENQALGEIIYCGKEFRPKSNSSGYFKVIDGVPHAGPRSLFDEYSGQVQYACQAHPSTMKDGVIFQYILDNSFAKWQQRTYRNLIGEKEDGSIVFIASGNGGLLDVREITQIAQLIGVKNATLFDAGVALQYAFETPGYSMEFSAFNNTLDAGTFVDKVGMELYRKNFIQRSPIYIGIKLHE